ncbi:MAG: glycoside hydrolase family 2, partial [Segatella copri]|nr:glycoside hydrolase family 2 [Segatella copri]
MRYYILMAMMLLLGVGSAKASAYDDTSVAGLFPVSNQGREVWNFNPNWRFHLGDVQGAERADYDDTSWGVVSTPHSVKLEPAEASGCRNYQGIAWYRKTFIVPGNRSEIYFEAIMGKQKIYVNGKLAKEHFGGYLPVIVNLKEQGLKKGDKCVVAVMADNSNDKSYPPGKPQYTLDFAYHGGIYRDVWLINKKEISITNVIEADRRDAGIFVHFSDISEKQAKVFVDVDLQNVGGKARKVKVEQSLLDASGKVLKTISQNVLLAAGDAHQTVRQMFSVRNPHLWSPETPYLYSVVTRIKDGKQVLDGGKTKLG